MSQYTINTRLDILNHYINKGYLTKNIYNELIKFISLPHNKWEKYKKEIFQKNSYECYLNLRLNWLLEHYNINKYILIFFNREITMINLLKLDEQSLKQILLLNCNSFIDSGIIFNFIFNFKNRLFYLKKINTFIYKCDHNILHQIENNPYYIFYTNIKELNDPELSILLENKVVSFYDLKDLGFSESLISNILDYIQKNKKNKDISQFSKSYYVNNSLFSGPVENYLFK